MRTLLDLLQPPAAAAGSRIAGVATAVVTNNEDPEKLGRVKLRFPWLSDDQESTWARVAAPMAGKAGGLLLLPAVDDEVLVAFEQGNLRHPYVVGALWNQGTPPPADGAAKSAITISAKDNTITITCDGDLTLESVNGKLVLKGAKGVEVVSSGGDVTVKGNTIELN